MTQQRRYQLRTWLIASVWLMNGLFCKVLKLVPRHEQIVARILGEQYAETLTLFIGLSEIGMAIWILTNIRPKYNAITQMVLVMLMNIIEWICVPDLLLWGRLNIFFALVFVGIVYYHTFIAGLKQAK